MINPCPHCGGKQFERIPGNFGLIKMDDNALNEVGVFGRHTSMVPLSLTVCTNCNHLAISYNFDAKR